MLNLQSESARTLRNALRANAVFSAISGLIIVFAHAQVLQWLGLSDISIVALGIGLMVFSAYLFWMSSRQALQRELVTGVIAGDWAWVAASVALLVFKGGMFSTLGLFLVIDVAVVVMVFAIMQQRGLSRLASTTD
jgi:hypothetical protein